MRRRAFLASKDEGPLSEPPPTRAWCGSAYFGGGASVGVRATGRASAVM